ncbi:MAG: hypothetical protein GYA23_07125 [Methanomicrobiales archaeon]|nr:hypothetical protein [Methanomicrobiales archaeon]
MAPAGAITADYTIFENGTAYRAVLQINDTERYTFATMGFMGEDVPQNAGEVNLTKEDMPAAFNWSRPWGASSSISFPKGNYTISYVAPLKDNNLQAAYTKPYNVSVRIPQNFSVQNPLLAGLSNGANVTKNPDNTTTVQWTKSFGFDLRFYSKSQEDLLFFFLQFMAILIVVLVIIPYVLSMRGQE